MGHSSVVVRFEDGTVRYALYQNTSDVIVGRLYDSDAAARDGYNDPALDDWDPGDGPREPVEIAVHYGGGFTFDGIATRQAIVEPVYPDGQTIGWGEEIDPVPQRKGTPEWAD